MRNPVEGRVVQAEIPNAVRPIGILLLLHLFEVPILFGRAPPVVKLIVPNGVDGLLDPRMEEESGCVERGNRLLPIPVEEVPDLQDARLLVIIGLTKVQGIGRTA